jgi:hypothetical protein
MRSPVALSSTRIVPREFAAQYQSIGKDRNEGKPECSAVFVLTGGGTSLDGMQLRNVVLQNVHIVYQGGPVLIKNVYFINCTFEITSAPNSQNLALAMLAPAPATTFSGE